jgi:hypothetical protein
MGKASGGITDEAWGRNKPLKRNYSSRRGLPRNPTRPAQPESSFGSNWEVVGGVFGQFLWPKSRLAWAELNQLWQGKTSLAEVVVAETGATLRPRWWQFWRRSNTRSPSELLNQVEMPESRKIIEQMARE